MPCRSAVSASQCFAPIDRFCCCLLTSGEFGSRSSLCLFACHRLQQSLGSSARVAELTSWLSQLPPPGGRTARRVRSFTPQACAEARRTQKACAGARRRGHPSCDSGTSAFLCQVEQSCECWLQGCSCRLQENSSENSTQ